MRDRGSCYPQSIPAIPSAPPGLVDAFPRQVKGGELVLVQLRLHAIGNHPRVESQIHVGKPVVSFHHDRRPHIAVPTFEISVIAVVDLENIVEAVGVVNLPEQVAVLDGNPINSNSLA